MRDLRRQNIDLYIVPSLMVGDGPEMDEWAN